MGHIVNTLPSLLTLSLVSNRLGYSNYAIAKLLAIARVWRRESLLFGGEKLE